MSSCSLFIFHSIFLLFYGGNTFSAFSEDVSLNFLSVIFDRSGYYGDIIYNRDFVTSCGVQCHIERAYILIWHNFSWPCYGHIFWREEAKLCQAGGLHTTSLLLFSLRLHLQSILFSLFLSLVLSSHFSISHIRQSITSQSPCPHFLCVLCFILIPIPYSLCFLSHFGLPFLLWPLLTFPLIWY